MGVWHRMPMLSTVFPRILEHATMYVIVNTEHAPFVESKISKKRDQMKLLCFVHSGMQQAVKPKIWIKTAREIGNAGFFKGRSSNKNYLLKIKTFDFQATMIRYFSELIVWLLLDGNVLSIHFQFSNWWRHHYVIFSGIFNGGDPKSTFHHLSVSVC